MKLSDWTLRHLMKQGDLVLTPEPEDVAMQPVSIDLRLGTSFSTVRGGYTFTNTYTLRPGEFILGTTMERVRLGRALVGQVVGKSTLAREGLQVEAAGLVDPGFDGCITLELKNLSAHPIPLTAGMYVCQIVFDFTDRPVDRPYGHPDLGSHYQGQTEATPSVRGR